LSLRERLRLQSIRDPLTGLFSRRYLEESAARELARCERRDCPLSLLMLDIDHFKAFNDLHGHAGGDALLARFGKLLAEHSRGEDIACRYGGEEFTLILPEAPAEAALQRAEAIRAAVGGMRVRHMDRELPKVTVSIGVATFPADGDSARGADAGRGRGAVSRQAQRPQPDRAGASLARVIRSSSVVSTRASQGRARYFPARRRCAR